MRKILTLLLIVLMICTLAGCSKKDETPVDDNQETEDVVDVITDDEQNDNPTEEDDSVIRASDYFAEGWTVKTEITYTNGLKANSDGVYDESMGCFFSEDTGECYLTLNSEDENTVSLKLDFGQLQAEEMVFLKDTLPTLEAEQTIQHYGPNGFENFTDNVRIDFIQE